MPEPGSLDFFFFLLKKLSEFLPPSGKTMLPQGFGKLYRKKPDVDWAKQAFP